MATLKPRPVLPKSYDEAEALYKKAGEVLGKPKKRTVIKKKTMTEQTKPSLPKPYVQSHLSDIQLIERNALWEDFKNRMKINNREVGYAMADLKQVVHKTKELYSKFKQNV